MWQTCTLTFASISANIKRLTDLGAQVHITEMDVALPVDAEGNAHIEDLQRQADIYRQIADACLVPSWMHGDPDLGFHRQVFLDRIALETPQGAALPFDREYRAKPAYEALREALESRKQSLVVGR